MNERKEEIIIIHHKLEGQRLEMGLGLFTDQTKRSPDGWMACGNGQAGLRR